MTASPSTFPLSGVIGIVDSSAEQLDQAKTLQLHCVEVRADLLRTAGFSDTELLAVVTAAKSKGLACLFTLRHADQGGTFNGDENERVALCRKALDTGADIIDLEHGTQASTILMAESAPMILSYHNFKAMLCASELATLTQAMESQKPLAIKIIPTGTTIADTATMLSWVGEASNSIRRIGFSMGRAGAVSRIITMAHGAPVTYASFGEPVAPGQIDIAVLIDDYKCNDMGLGTKINAVVGEQHQIAVFVAKQHTEAKQSNEACVWIGFDASDRHMLELHQQSLKISEIIVL